VPEVLLQERHERPDLVTRGEEDSLPRGWIYFDGSLVLFILILHRLPP
jgi:hypothetical protein